MGRVCYGGGIAHTLSARCVRDEHDGAAASLLRQQNGHADYCMCRRCVALPNDDEPSQSDAAAKHA